MSRRIKVAPEDFAGMMEEVLRRLARDPEAAHLWQWQPRPGCADEPPGPSRRNHLSALLGLLGAAALPGALAGCGGSRSTPAPDMAPDKGWCAEDPGHWPHDMQPVPDAPQPDLPQKRDIGACGDDPCGCADDPCSCGDDPCNCADDPCACADLPQPDLPQKPDLGICGDDPCNCADDPCNCGDDPCFCADDPCSSP